MRYYYRRHPQPGVGMPLHVSGLSMPGFVASPWCPVAVETPASVIVSPRRHHDDTATCCHHTANASNEDAGEMRQLLDAVVEEILGDHVSSRQMSCPFSAQDPTVPASCSSKPAAHDCGPCRPSPEDGELTEEQIWNAICDFFGYRTRNETRESKCQSQRPSLSHTVTDDRRKNSQNKKKKTLKNKDAVGAARPDGGSPATDKKPSDSSTEDKTSQSAPADMDRDRTQAFILPGGTIVIHGRKTSQEETKEKYKADLAGSSDEKGGIPATDMKPSDPSTVDKTSQSAPAEMDKDVTRAFLLPGGIFVIHGRKTSQQEAKEKCKANAADTSDEKRDIKSTKTQPLSKSASTADDQDKTSSEEDQTCEHTEQTRLSDLDKDELCQMKEFEAKEKGGNQEVENEQKGECCQRDANEDEKEEKDECCLGHVRGVTESGDRDECCLMYVKETESEEDPITEDVCPAANYVTPYLKDGETALVLQPQGENAKSTSNVYEKDLLDTSSEDLIDVESKSITQDEGTENRNHSESNEPQHETSGDWVVLDTTHSLSSDAVVEDSRTSEDASVKNEVSNYTEFQRDFDMKGFCPADISVKVHNGKLVVAAERTEDSDGGESFHQFRQTISLPDDVIIEDMTSRLSRDGVLSVSAPRQENYERYVETIED